MDIIDLKTSVVYTFFKMFDIRGNILALIVENKGYKIVCRLCMAFPKIARFVNKNTQLTHYSRSPAIKNGGKFFPPTVAQRAYAQAKIVTSYNLVYAYFIMKIPEMQ